MGYSKTIGYVRKNDEILESFRALEREHPIETTAQEIGDDGLMYRGDFITTEAGAIIRTSGIEERLWEESDCRIMFVTKDINGEVYDIRIDPNRTPNGGEIDSFFKRLMFNAYGLYQAKKGKYVPFEELDDKICQEFYECSPIVRINCKKVAGGSEISSKVFNKYTFESEPRKELLIKQIRNWEPDIIVACGSDTVYPFLHRECYHDWINRAENGCSLYVYCQKENLVILNGNHPKVRKSYREDYEHLISCYLDALDRHPGLRES